MKSKTVVRIVAVILAVLLIGSVFAIMIPMLADAATVAPTKGGSGYISGDYVNLRNGAGTSYGILTTMRKNTKVVFVDGKLSSSGWYKITEQTGKMTGYVYKDYVTATASPEPTEPSENNRTGYINADYVNLRKGAGTNYDVVTTMRQNTGVTLLKSSAQNNWYNVKTSEGKSGYVYADYVALGSSGSSSGGSGTDGSAKTGYVNADYVNLRKGAGTSYPALTTMRKNTKFTFVSTSQKNGWYNIKLSDGTTGYIYASYATEDKTAPTVAPTTVKPTTAPATTKPKATTAPATTKPQSTTAPAAATGYINVDYVNLRKGAGTKYDVITTMRINTKFTFVSTTATNGWYNIKLSDGTTGYVYGEYVTFDNQTSPTNPENTGKFSLSNTKETIYVGNELALTANNGSSVSWTSSNASVASVDTKGIVTAKAAGSATIKATSGGSSASCAVTVKSNGGGVTLSKTSASLPKGKSLMLTASNHSGWKTSNSSIATVSRGVVEAKKTGYVSIFAYNSYGMTSCLVRVTAAENVRFVYASPNSAPKNSTVSFKAITDSDRTAVRFEVSNGSTKYTVNASKKEKDGNNLIWTGTKQLSVSGEWQIKAYSKTASGSYATTAESGEGTVFVTNSTDTKTTVLGERRASDGVIRMISTFEGFLSDLTDDYITDDPTIGYGRVIFSNEQFYNHLTENEAYAYLCQTVNTGGYTSRTNALLTQNNVKFNQQQFDALVCFAYNVGAYAISSDSNLKSILFNSSGSGGAVKAGAAGYVNEDYVNLRKGAGTNYGVETTMEKNTAFTFVDAKLYNSNWYKIKLSDGTVGYIYSDYASVKGGDCDLNNINKTAFTNAMLQYHHASGECWWGLLYRRIDEVEMFLYGDYDIDGRSNYNHFNFTCSSNPSFSIS